MSFTKAFLNEARAIFSDAALLLTILGGVVLYAFLYPQPYSLQSVRSLHISVVDYDKTDLSREISFMLDSTPQVEITRHDMSEEDAKAALTSGEIKGIVVIPKDFKKDVTLKRSPTVAIGADSSYFLIYGGVLEAAMKSVLTQAAKIKVASLLAKGESIAGVKNSLSPFSLKTINLFNAQNSYTQYVVPAVFVLILQQTMLIGLGILGGGINERYYKNYSYNTPVSFVILSRMFIFFSIFFIHMMFYFGFVYQFFGISYLSSLAPLAGFSTLFLLTSALFGIFLGSLFSSREVATPVVLLSSLPLVFSAGFVWPLEAVPKWVQFLSDFFPSTPAIEGFLKLNQMGASLDMLHSNVMMLSVQSIVYGILGYYVITKKRRKNGTI